MIEGEGEQLIILAEKDPHKKRPEEEVIAEINHCIPVSYTHLDVYKRQI